MSIPIERRDIGEGWVLTCRGENGDDLRLSDVSVEKENLICIVLGSGNLLSPVMEHIQELKSIDPHFCTQNDKTIDPDENGDIEVSVLDHVGYSNLTLLLLLLLMPVNNVKPFDIK